MLNVKVYDGKITDNFNIAEFACKGGGEVLLNRETIDHICRLQRFRNWFNRPMTINSGYRTAAYNAKVGGAKNSMHVQGIATDFALPNEFYTFSKERQEQFLQNVKKKWFEICAADGLGGGVGFYKTFIHLDSRTGKSAHWDGR
ncbi:MAG: DUF882 domain-containing protein [Peptoclostridium sp.]|uniref:YcbK family protein n=1 Tax=Peptoclostridium sp. TaxID=1904860 RepID=UPI00139E2546|nr:D-Ala-D-Ala carboxypeptidase family metallohydrolase [Peptoclostridium sp.]MZQ75278.1 DUF882 domain-containing protein [Peptoclostridium sp.]